MIAQNKEELENDGDVDEAFRPSLLKAFSVFEQQCQALEGSHRVLKNELDKANLELEAKNLELAERLTENEEMRDQLSGILESITDAILLLDANGTIKQQNQAAQALQATCPGVLFSQEMQAMIQSRDFVRDREFTTQCQADKKIFTVTQVPMDDSLLVVIKDVTEYRELIKRVDREDRLTALGHVAANVAHEIRNPLQGVAGFVQLLQRDIQGNPLAERQVDRIMQATRQLNSVVTNLLSYTREMKLSLAKTDLTQLSQEITEMLSPRAESCKVTLSFDPMPPPVQAQTDSVQIKQVVSNLVTNAIEACDSIPGAAVSVSTGHDENRCWIAVGDNGCGMNKESCDRVFEPFYTSKSGGIGLGLALCRRIMDAHNGGIEVHSEPEKGTVFRLTFPPMKGETK